MTDTGLEAGVSVIDNQVLMFKDESLVEGWTDVMRSSTTLPAAESSRDDVPHPQCDVKDSDHHSCKHKQVEIISTKEISSTVQIYQDILYFYTA